MDAEVLIWTALFVGGYVVILGALFRVALKKNAEKGRE